MAIGVQLIGKDQVMQAFENMKVECWSIYQHKNLLTKGAGDQMLEEFLDLIAKNASAAVYTIKFYEDIDDAKKIKEKTESSGSLNFKLQGADFEGAGSGEYQERLYYRKLQEEINGLKNQINGVGDAPQTLEEAVIGLINSPTELVTVITLIKDILKPSHQQQPQQYGQYNNNAVGYLTNDNTMPNKRENLTEQQQAVELKRLQDAVTILDDNDPKLVEHLEKLAMMAKSNPNKFKMLLGLLENF